MIHFTCPTCRAIYESPDNQSGNTVACARCGQWLQIPQAPRNQTVLAPLVSNVVKPPPLPPQASAPSAERQAPRPAVPRKRPAPLPISSPAGGLTLVQALRKWLVLTIILVAGVGVIGAGIYFVAKSVRMVNDPPASNRLVARTRPGPDTARQVNPGTGASTSKSPTTSTTSQDDSQSGEVPRDSGAVKPGAGGSATVRLSGTHKITAGEGGLPTINDRSDLDLWLDNPVEADAKWKDRVAEVEMDLHDLSIVKQGDLAGLVTPTGDPWGRRGGWQSVAFTYQGDSSKQLIGLQKLQGLIVIRGECKGLVRGRLTFDHCEIVQRPGGNQPPKDDENPLSGLRDP